MAGKKNSFSAFINKAVSFGASIVIIGLLSKIQHWRSGELLISIGLITEALLFFILGFQPEEKDYDWTRAYPVLSDDYSGPKPVAAVAGDGFSNTAALDKMLADAKIGPQLIGSLADGLRTFGDKVSSISRVTDAGDATIAFTNKVKQATASYENLSIVFEKASANLSGLVNSNVDTKAYHDQVNNLARNLSSLNAVYELELQDSSAHLKAMNKFYQNFSLTMSNFSESLNDSKLFKEEVSHLAKNLSALNAVYGNMLSAMNQPRIN